MKKFTNKKLASLKLAKDQQLTKDQMKNLKGGSDHVNENGNEEHTGQFLGFKF